MLRLFHTTDGLCTAESRKISRNSSTASSPSLSMSCRSNRLSTLASLALHSMPVHSCITVAHCSLDMRPSVECASNSVVNTCLAGSVSSYSGVGVSTSRWVRGAARRSAGERAGRRCATTKAPSLTPSSLSVRALSAGSSSLPEWYRRIRRVSYLACCATRCRTFHSGVCSCAAMHSSSVLLRQGSRTMTVSVSGRPCSWCAWGRMFCVPWRSTDALTDCSSSVRQRCARATASSRDAAAWACSTSRTRAAYALVASSSGSTGSGGTLSPRSSPVPPAPTSAASESSKQHMHAATNSRATCGADESTLSCTAWCAATSSSAAAFATSGSVGSSAASHSASTPRRRQGSTSTVNREDDTTDDSAPACPLAARKKARRHSNAVGVSSRHATPGAVMRCSNSWSTAPAVSMSVRARNPRPTALVSQRAASSRSPCVVARDMHASHSSSASTSSSAVPHRRPKYSTKSSRRCTPSRNTTPPPSTASPCNAASSAEPGAGSCAPAPPAPPCAAARPRDLASDMSASFTCCRSAMTSGRMPPCSASRSRAASARDGHRGALGSVGTCGSSENVPSTCCSSSSATSTPRCSRSDATHKFMKCGRCTRYGISVSIVLRLFLAESRSGLDRPESSWHCCHSSSMHSRPHTLTPPWSTRPISFTSVKAAGCITSGSRRRSFSTMSNTCCRVSTNLHSSSIS
mmetsp:Transcript_18626/g.59311  ORF Transcript_18626/g.59311 Transcript_18626/m.59311 type:complete len:691 (+) Transcript_18626:554-2626(+)